jgi:hypothetical protein
LEADGVQPIPFKGPTLAAIAYQDLSLREFSDLDVLVQDADIAAAEGVLTATGYRSLRRLNYEHLFVRDDGVAVDLHWRLAHPGFPIALGPADLTPCRAPIRLAGGEVLALPAEHLLPVLCVHGTKHCWERLQWVCDVAELTRAHPELDWELVTSRARRFGVERLVLLGLRLAGDLLDVPLPEAVARATRRDRRVGALAALVRDGFLSDGEHALPRADAQMFQIEARERLRDRVRHSVYLARSAAAGGARPRLPLPALVALLYAALRPLWRLTKWGLRPFVTGARR